MKSTAVPPATSDRAALAAWHAQQAAALYDQAADDARKNGDETEANTCEAYATGARAQSRRMVASGTIRAGHRRTLVAPELVDLPPLPTQAAARRRIIRQRGW
ncbi:hypothetical protein NLX86_18925 [Streptomyces sp. A3M-1-3]|uniref:hypothetical protein n=1 Tax=Streptomyces sp. A3M-1-3 TaxID=2962044 RepID=UPI0020B85CA2|nr:hypothetical protein [Streptomyces sp. A3M-1-3]MCP3820092.1 hypothetical protein [Streptomyces sp. A3M-1-3]